jgi:microcin C transport system permease protein
MRDYFIRRFLLIIPTVLGATLVVFFITRITPGGPLEAAMQKAAEQAGSSGMRDAGASMSQEQKDELAAYYGFDRSFLPAYLAWLGAIPRHADKQFVKFEDDAEEADVSLRNLLPRDEWTPTNAYQITAAKVTKDGELTAENDRFLDTWTTHVEEAKNRIQVFRPIFDGVLQGNLGISTRYNEPVWGMIREKVPISLFFGVITLIATYGVCIPLGILKALKHRTWLDSASSVLIFVGYAIPGFALGSLMLLYLGARLGWFPLGGVVSDNYESLNAFQKLIDMAHHLILPTIAWVISSFAFMTMLVKNNLMDNLAADYVRTAVAKGADSKRAILGHALRNSMIPVMTTLGHIVSIFLTGSLLIELIFEIDGIGLLSYYSIVNRDYPVVMGMLLISTTLLLLGNILSDIFVALTDPRIRFH